MITITVNNKTTYIDNNGNVIPVIDVPLAQVNPGDIVGIPTDNTCRTDSNVPLCRLGTNRWNDSDGKLHRNGGPSLIYPYGDEFWHQHGKLHREDGPAVIYGSGYVCWYLNDVKYTFEEWAGKATCSFEKKVELYNRYVKK